MPFTLAHPAAVLPLLRPPFVPVALIAGSMAPDAPYFLTAAGITSTSADDWYGSFLNATTTHSLAGLPIDLYYTAVLVAAYLLLRAPITALGLALPKIGRPNVLWLILSALIGAGTHLLWDFLTDADFVPVLRLLQYASTAFGLVVIGWYLWKHRSQFQGATTLKPGLRRMTVAVLIAAPALGAAVLARSDFVAYREATDTWTAVAEGVLTGAIKRAGAAFAVALLLYAATWRIAPTSNSTTTSTRRSS
ncbi:DUF4184 family protein [Kribbella sp. NPDC058245]|uniref:DUF4184 family protein n=1 Tax=Kribbella sp. NPDC058245 TaxID=3346399 RepID=UPI0036E57E57